jgi:serine/threonine protein phosphatase PrpC
MLRAANYTWKTDTGRQRRDNEDSAFARAPLFVVADGMGGAQAGEVASQLAVEAFEDELSGDGSTEQRLARRAQDANRRIYEISSTEHERAGMGTTLTAVYVDESNLAVAHVGDSRAYLFRDGELGRMTQDHTLVDALIRAGKLTEEQAAEHPQRSVITRALGVDPEVEVDTWSYPARAGDVVLLCSDGLTSMISEEQIARILADETDLDRAAERLIADANEAGGRDNITVILFRLEEAGGPDGSPSGTDAPTMIGRAPTGPDSEIGSEGPRAGTLTAPRIVATAAPSPPARRAPLARTQGVRRDRGQRAKGRRARFARPVAALVAVVVVLFLVGGGGYLASRQLFFVGTNAQGIVTIFRGLPYDLPFGIRLYETFYVSGLPAQSLPGPRRAQLLNHDLRSQTSAVSLVRAAELGQLAR